MREFQTCSNDKSFNEDSVAGKISPSKNSVQKYEYIEDDGQKSEALTSCSTTLGAQQIEIVKEKERALKKAKSVAKEPSMCKEELFGDKGVVRNIADNLKLYYGSRKVSNMFLVNVVNYLQKNNSFGICYQGM